jgi:uncharacterized protein YegP (UPF0339 family)
MAKFEIYQDNPGEYRFRLKGANDEIIVASEGFTTRTNAERGVEAVKRVAPLAQVVHLAQRL